MTTDKSILRANLSAEAAVNNARDHVRAAVQAGAKLRNRLGAMRPADRAALFMAIEAERDAMQLPRTQLCLLAGVSTPHCERLVRVNGSNVSVRFLVSMVRGLRSAKAGEKAPAARLTDFILARAAYAGCLAAACSVTGANSDEVTVQLGRTGELTSDAAWRKASETRSIALYLASCELGLKPYLLATLSKLTPAAVSYALNRIELRRDDDPFDAALDRAAEKVRG
jgi:hypothetical protein